MPASIIRLITIIRIIIVITPSILEIYELSYKRHVWQYSQSN